MTRNISTLAQLRMLLESMEHDLGLKKLTPNERDLLYAAQNLSGETNEYVRSEELKGHPLLKSMTQPTYYRSLKRLLELGFIELPSGKKTGLYRVNFSIVID
ncbi:hypothetical protein [Roseobacter weihaiensis]|uniref:hypothetical protein n=1 Tax=Roseobacter weihaiensis TaxID=2763262 RepID=UPI001D0A6FA4|nr:hypothetical protein [Roseobacter sp. H9]